MDRATEIRLIKEIIGLADQRSAYLDNRIAESPIARYTSPERFAEEMRTVFTREPVAIAHGSELAEPSAFVTTRFRGLPLLITRDNAGTVAAFLNVCRHRGATLERAVTGCKQMFTCPYHGWSWRANGDLYVVPHEAQGFPALDHASRGLRRVPVAEAHGFIWVIADPNSEATLDMAAWLDGLDADFDWLDLRHHRVAVTDTLDVRANWKLLVEGGLEAYHFRVAHKQTIAPYFPDNLSTYTRIGPHIRSVLPRTTLVDLRDTPEADWQIRRDANLLYTTLTNTQLLVQQDHVVWVHAEPLAHDLTRLRLSTLVPDSAKSNEAMDAHWRKNQAISVATLQEDFDLGEEIQTGLLAGANPSHLFGRFEGALNHFNAAVEAAMQRAAQ